MRYTSFMFNESKNTFLFRNEVSELIEVHAWVKKNISHISCKNHCGNPNEQVSLKQASKT